ncbi:hypothetical protein GCWU000341_01669 [Oribacterium sp. oral taxon 078 str. F0262]|nr:hypothetical protein GCWU000341_01669 [Oribacterium sp. oral taxon 078 str. F0262]
MSERCFEQEKLNSVLKRFDERRTTTDADISTLRKEKSSSSPR